MKSYKIVSIFAYILFLTTICMAGIIAYESDDLWLSIFIGFGIFLLGMLGYPALLRWSRHQAKKHAPSADEILAKDYRPPVIYLRSFREDGTRSAKLTWVFTPFPTYITQPTYEEQISGYFRKIGPFITLSGSGYGPPEVGAARLMTKEENWRQTFEDLIHRCSLIVFRAGDSESLLWELNQLVARIDSRKVIIYLQIGEEDDPGVQQARYNKFRRVTASVFPRPLPEQRKKNLYLTFGQNWEPILGKNLKKVLQSKGYN